MRAPLTAEEARARTDEIRAVITEIGDDQEMVSVLLEAAARDRVHLALSYDTYPAYVEHELGLSSARLHADVAVRLRQRGLSQRAIADLLGVDESAVRRYLAGVFGGVPVQDVRDPDRGPVDSRVTDRPEEEQSGASRQSPWRRRARAEGEALRRKLDAEEAALRRDLEHFREELAREMQKRPDDADGTT